MSSFVLPSEKELSHWEKTLQHAQNAKMKFMLFRHGEDSRVPKDLVETLREMPRLLAAYRAVLSQEKK